MYKRLDHKLKDNGIFIRLIAITWIITKLLCYKLWLADRLFPLVPIHESLEQLPAFFHSALFYVSLAAMFLLVVFPGKKLAALILVTEILSCLLDQNRWQPWEYQFILMTAVYVFAKEDKELRRSWMIILVGIYFFSGLGKLNSGFIHDIWQNLMLRRWLDIAPGNILLTRSGYALPLIEMAAALALLFSPFKKIALWILLCMHVLILVMFGPAGLNINAVIWPWNILMPILLFGLFYKDSFYWKNLLVRKPMNIILVLCCWILPWFQLAGYWDKYLSSVLYSGGLEQLFICTEKPLAKEQMYNYFKKDFRVIPCANVISVYEWGIKEMNTAPYPERRVYKAIIRSWEKRFPGGGDQFYLFKPGFSFKLEKWK